MKYILDREGNEIVDYLLSQCGEYVYQMIESYGGNKSWHMQSSSEYTIELLEYRK